MALTFLLLLLLVAAPCCRAQPSIYDDPYRSNFNALTAVLIVVIVSAFFFLAFFSLYFRRCSRHRSSVAPAVSGAATRRGGLDPEVIGTFPIMPYTAVAGIKIGKEALECAVCLSEFTGGETLRMLPRCCHVFHPDCIDTWLGSHVTCPVCRDDLSAGPAVPGAGEVAVCRAGLGRSQSTGHVRGPGDRFTLRLPEHVRRDVVAAGGMRRSASAAVFGGGGEGSLRRGYRGGAGSRSLWAGLSDRWASGILTRVSTWRRGESAEGSSRGGTKLSEDSSVGALGRV